MSDDTLKVDSEAPATSDTVNDQNQQASPQSKESPEATQENVEAQEATSPETKATDTEEKLYAGKYKTEEELERAYKELESKFGKTASEKAELTKAIDQSLAPNVQPGVPGDINAVNDSLARDNAVIKFMMSHDDADPQVMEEILTTDPHVTQIGDYSTRLEYAYLRSQNMSKAKAIEEATKEAVTQTEAKIIEKQTAQVESAQKAESVDEVAELRDRAFNGNTSQEREAARIELIKRTII